MAPNCQTSPGKWMSMEWRKVYGYPKQGEGMASQTDYFIDSKFSTRINPKDGYAVSECKHVRARQVLEFLIPILCPEKPTWVTITVGNTIFGALSEERPVDWALVMMDVVQRVFAEMERSKAMSICPYIFHMYYIHDSLLSGKKKAYRIAEAFLKHNMEPEKEDEPVASEDSEGESLSSGEIRELQAHEAIRLKKSPPNKRGLLAAQEPTELPRTSPLMESMEPSYDLKRIWAWEIIQGKIIQAACKKLNKCKPEDLVAAIDNLPTRKKVDELETKNNFLLVKANKLKNELDEQKAKHQTAINKLNTSLHLNQKLEEYVSHLGDVLNKA